MEVRDHEDRAALAHGPAPETGDREQPGWPALAVNEMMADNRSTLAEDDGSYSDWIELYNSTDQAVALDGWTLTDKPDEDLRYPLDDLSVAAGGFLVLWADGDETLGAGHLGFKLDEGGEAVGLFAPDGAPIDGLRYGEQAADISLARLPDGGPSWALASPATPGSSNGGGS